MAVIYPSVQDTRILVRSRHLSGCSLAGASQKYAPNHGLRAALAWLVDQNDVIRTQFAVTVTELQDNTQVMQPEIKEALSILLDN